MSEHGKDWSVRITHMVQACEEIQTYTAGMRHIITHDYDRTRDMIIWMALQNKVPKLLDDLNEVKSAMGKE